MITKLIAGSVKTAVVVVTSVAAIATAMTGAVPNMHSLTSIAWEVGQEQDLDELIAQLGAPEAYDRALAACRIGRLRHTDTSGARAALIEMLADGTPVESRLCRDARNWGGGRRGGSTPGREAAIALEDIGDAAVEPVISVLSNANPVARENAALALGLLERRQAVAPIAGALDDSVAAVRSRAAWALGMIEHRDGVPALTAAIRDGDAGVREQVVWALGMIEDPAGVEGLVRALDDDVADVREQAAWAIGMIEHESGVEPLIDALGDDDADVREQAAWALGMIEDPGAVEALTNALEDEDAGVRKQVLWALMRCVDAHDADLDYAELAEKLRVALRRGGV